MSEKIVVLGDKLSMYYNASVSTFQVVAKPKSKKMISNVHACSLTDICRSFGNDHILTRMAI